MADSENDIKNHASDTIVESKKSCVSLFEHFQQELQDPKGGFEYTVKVTRIYLCSLVLSIVLHIVDVGTDVFLAYQYFHLKEIYAFLLTVAFVVIPTFISTMLSIKMYAVNTEPASWKKWTFRSFGLFLQFAPLIRYSEALQYALKVRNKSKLNPREYEKYSRLLLMEDSNLALLRIIEGFLEAAPQQVLQIAILLQNNDNNSNYWLQIYQYMSICSSLVSIAWSFAGYNRSIRFARMDKRKMSWTGSIFQVSWFFLVTSSRILAISEAASTYPRITFMACVFHWLLMTTWISVFDRTWFCRRSDSDSKINNSMEFVFCAVLGLVYLFEFLPTRDGATRGKYLFYYSVYFLENTTALALWVTWASPKVRSSWWFYPVLVVTFCLFVFGIAFMMVYYWYFHPERGVVPLQARESEAQHSSGSNEDVSCSTKMVQTSE